MELKDSHREKLERNERYRMIQLEKVRERYADESTINNEIIQTQRIEQVMATARRNKMIKMTLSHQNRDELNSFEKNFLKRGNSSIRKDMHKF